MGEQHPRRGNGYVAAAALLLAVSGCVPSVATETAANSAFGGGGGPNTWTPKTAAPAPISAGCAGAVGTEIFVFSGSTTYIYDTVTDSWGTGTTMPNPRADVACVTIGSFVYVIGGYDVPGSTPSVQIEIYNTVTDGWIVPGSTLTLARHALGAGTSNGFIYIFGGFDGGGQDTLLEQYDPSLDTIGVFPAMGTGLSDIKGSGYAADDRIFTFGGKNGGNAAVNTTQFYDVALSNWNTVTNGLTRYGVMVEQVGGQMYVIGGFDNVSYFFENQRFDPVGWSWTSLANMPTPRYLAQSAVVGSDIYVIGGIVAGGGATTVNEMYTP